MRQKRAKAYRKLMTLYSISFGFRQPYQVLIDSEMCKTAIQSSTDFTKQLGTVLQGTVKPMITQCCIHELYLQGKSMQPAVDLAKSFERRKCNHKEAIPGDECLTSVVGATNKHRYVVASQSQSLRASFRKIPAVPAVHVNRSVMVLEPPSDATLKAKQDADEKALGASKSELATLPAAAVDVPRKKKGPKGPNPLSIKKKKQVSASNGASKTIPLNIGQKRGHESEEDVETETELPPGDIIEHEEHGGEPQGGHRRKRKRKTNNITATDV